MSVERATTESFERGDVRCEQVGRPLPEALRPWVRRCVGYEERSTKPLARRELPVPRIVVLIELGPPVRVHDSENETQVTRFEGGFAAGLDDRQTLTSHDGRQRGILIELTCPAATRFFARPMRELAGRVVALPDLLPREHRTLAERLGSLADWDARLDVVETLLAERLTRSTARSELAAWACQRIEAWPAIDLGTLSREAGYSQKFVIELFHEQVGLTPKQFARVVRFDRLVQYLRGGGGGAWAELAQRFGWYDQAHLSNDMKRILGVSPEKARGVLSNALSDEFKFFQAGPEAGG
jgi:AraC-like DNA-binding protein